MYLVLPWLYWLAIKPSGANRLALLIVAACGGAAVLAQFTHGHLNMAGYLPCFLAGVLCFSLSRQQRPILPAALWLPFVLTLVLVYCGIHTLLAIPHPEYALGWAYCLILGLTINLFHDSKFAPLNFIAHRAARYSYGMYLFHVPVLYLVFDYCHLSDSVLATVLYFVITVALSAVTFYSLEKPMIAVGRRLSDGRSRRVVPERAQELLDGNTAPAHRVW